jgi:hypothetical protein
MAVLLSLCFASVGWADWVPDGAALSTAAYWQYGPKIAPDGAGGAIVTWFDNRDLTFDIYAQRINPSGAVLWTTDGAGVCVASGEQMDPAICTDGAGGAIIAYEDDRAGDQDIYVQRVSSAGVTQWTTYGVAACTTSYIQHRPMIVSDGAGGAIVTWEDSRSVTETDIYAQRLSSAGVPQWAANGVSICTHSGNQYVPTIVPDGAGGAVITWIDYRNGNSDIYAQRVNASGAVHWTADGVAVCTNAGAVNFVRIASDGDEGAIISWRDTRSVNWDIYAQRVSWAGVVQWTADGVALCTETANQTQPAITSDGAGGAIVSWQDPRSGAPGLYAQRVNASGATQWTANGVLLCLAADPVLVPGDNVPLPDGAGGAIVTWTDYRDSAVYPDIYAQRVDASGTVMWETNGVALCTADKDQIEPVLVADDEGGAIVTWADRRSGSDYDVYAQRISHEGDIGGSFVPISGMTAALIATALGSLGLVRSRRGRRPRR